jgi:hypothetical protein
VLHRFAGLRHERKVIAMIEGERKQRQRSPLNECEMSDDEIDLSLAETFPASDPPSWTLGTKHCEDSTGEPGNRDSRKEVLPQEDEA